MTVNRDFKRIVRRRMRKTGESYTAARRHFLVRQGPHMTTQAARTDETMLELPIDQLQLTLETTRILKAQGIEHVGQLLEKTVGGTDALQLETKRAIEVRDVLASRGL